ncbi:O-antigen ligase family protein [uncultured Desulfobacter sp.]|uniref:O-antigen ligase family protein n=1 Tax=uncultured Desulfobacter sp. TaxID=240139 RepID=UPI0029F4C8FA|nr:O-antigen ligase family protein [uncultured Desulfobacter sp.]
MFFYYIMIFLFPFHDHPILSASIFGVTTVKIAGIAATIVALMNLFQGGNGFIATRKVIIPYLFCLFCYFASYLLNDTTLSLEVFPRFLSVSVLLFTSSILLDSYIKIWKVLLVFSAAMNISSLYVVKQHLYGVIRPGGTFGDSNFYAIAAAFTAALCLSLWAYQKKYKIFFMISFILNSSSVLLSGSRGGCLALIVSLLYFWYKHRNKLIGALLICLACGAFFVLIPNNMLERFEGEDYGARVSTEHRLKIIAAGFDMIQKNPVIGVGPGMFKIETIKYLGSEKMAKMAHNSYLEVGAEFGMLGVCAWFCLCYSSIRQLHDSLRIASKEDEKIFACLHSLLVAVSGYFIGALFLSVEYEKVLWLTISIASVSVNIVLKEILPPPPRLHKEYRLNEDKR